MATPGSSRARGAASTIATSAVIAGDVGAPRGVMNANRSCSGGSSEHPGEPVGEAEVADQRVGAIVSPTPRSDEVERRLGRLDLDDRLEPDAGVGRALAQPPARRIVVAGQPPPAGSAAPPRAAGSSRGSPRRRSAVGVTYTSSVVHTRAPTSSPRSSTGSATMPASSSPRRTASAICASCGSRSADATPRVAAPELARSRRRARDGARVENVPNATVPPTIAPRTAHRLLGSRAAATARSARGTSSRPARSARARGWCARTARRRGPPRAGAAAPTGSAATMSTPSAAAETDPSLDRRQEVAQLLQRHDHDGDSMTEQAPQPPAPDRHGRGTGNGLPASRAAARFVQWRTRRRCDAAGLPTSSRPCRPCRRPCRPCRRCGRSRAPRRRSPRW